MIIIKDNIIYSDTNKYVHKTGTDIYFKRAFKLNTDTVEMFEEIEKIPDFEKEAYYRGLVSQKIRSKYSQDDEFAILRQRDSKPEEFAEYNVFAEKCKVEAKAEIDALSDDWTREYLNNK